MNILLVLIPVTLLVVAIAVVIFFWAVNHQQFDDLDSPAILPLLDDPDPAGETARPPDSPASRFPSAGENRDDPRRSSTCPDLPENDRGPHVLPQDG